MNNADPSGYWLETVLDLVSLNLSLNDMITDPSWENAGWLALDIVSLVIPCVTGSIAIKTVNTSMDLVDTGTDAIKGAGKADAQFTQALKKFDKSGLRPGQKEISKSRVMEIVNNYDCTKAYSSVYRDASGRYLVEGHHTTVANKILGRGSGFNMNVPTSLPPSTQNVNWTKNWYEFWKQAIQIKP